MEFGVTDRDELTPEEYTALKLFRLCAAPEKSFSEDRFNEDLVCANNVSLSVYTRALINKGYLKRKSNTLTLVE